MLFFDLEFYVPKQDRLSVRSSMIVNPAKLSHTLLGGAFYSQHLRSDVPLNPALDGHWLWDYASDERKMLTDIKARFEREWTANRNEKEEVLGKPIEDLVVCGAGISRFDLPALYCRSVLHEIAPPDDLFDLFLKPKAIDLANTGSCLFREDRTLYPKTTREMAGRLRIPEGKGSSKSVWTLYEENALQDIRARTEEEVRTVIRIYSSLRDRIAAN